MQPYGPGPYGQPQPPPPPGYGYPMAAPPQKSSSGCTTALVILAVSAVPLIGILAALGIYGVRRYLASAKVAEAKQTVGAISRGATAAYERERPSPPAHRLCESSGPDALGHGPVPRTVPQGKKYQPATIAGQDFETGSELGGWRCLKFSLTQPHYFQYHYNKGGGYLSPMAPGADGYEAAAKGDLDADGNESLFARHGEIVAGQLRSSTQIYIENEFE